MKSTQMKKRSGGMSISVLGLVAICLFTQSSAFARGGILGGGPTGPGLTEPSGDVDPSIGDAELNPTDEPVLVTSEVYDSVRINITNQGRMTEVICDNGASVSGSFNYLYLSSLVMQLTDRSSGRVSYIDIQNCHSLGLLPQI